MKTKRLILGFGVLDLVSGDQGAGQRAEESLASFARVMDELEECGMDNVANHCPWAALAGKGGVRLPSGASKRLGVPTSGSSSKPMSKLASEWV